ncbi:MAG: c-type cytochrome [Gemmatimonadetes bacterium]|jgi:mono/diheme cytochrome c family protein|nr:c-type cytochrome [Gemmatimonadota bacterium]
MRALLSLAVGLSVGSANLAAQATPAPELSTFETVRTGRLLRDRLSCLGCHRLGTEGGTIGPALDGLSARADMAYVVRMIQDPSAVIPGTLMPTQPMPDREARRLAAYILSAGSAPSPPSAPTQAPPALQDRDRLDGAALYARNCAACHGERGSGDGWNAPNLPVAPTAHSDATLMAQRADDTLYDAISAGGFVLDRSPRMPAFGTMLEPQQIRALIRHIRTLCACEGPSWSRGLGR